MIAVAIVAALCCPWSRVFETSAARHLRQLGAPAGAGPIRDVREYRLDGTSPEMASGYYRLRSTPAAIADHYRAACRRLALRSPAGAETRAYYPDALCDGAVIVTVTARCATGECRAFVEVIA